VRIIVVIALLVLLISPVEAIKVNVSNWWSYKFEELRSLTLLSNGDFLAYDGHKIYVMNESNVKWSVNCESCILSTCGDKIAVGDGGVRVYDLNGSLSWSSDLDGRVSCLKISKYVVVGTVKGFLYLFNSTGAEIWRYKLESGVADVDYLNDFVVAVDSIGNLYYFTKCGPFPWKSTTGNEDLDWIYRNGWCIWKFDGLAKVMPFSSIEVFETYDGVVVVNGDLKEVFYFSKGGDLIWKRALMSKPVSVSIGNERIAIGCEDGETYLLDSDGNIVWKVDLKSKSIVDIAEGYTVVGSGNLLCLINESGDVVWATYLESPISYVSVGKDLRIVAGSESGEIYVVVPAIQETQIKTTTTATVVTTSVATTTTVTTTVATTVQAKEGMFPNISTGLAITPLAIALIPALAVGFIAKRKLRGSEKKTVKRKRVVKKVKSQKSK
jgi:outer membrane protein assembly factor BamB